MKNSPASGFQGVRESVNDNEGADSTSIVSQENIFTPSQIKISNVSFTAPRQHSASQEHLEEMKDDMVRSTYLFHYNRKCNIRRLP